MQVKTDEKSIGEIVRKAEQDFINGYTTKSKYVDESLYEDINKIEAYLNSKHISGPTDSKGRDKPFFNISLGARNIWYRATDIDRKNIKIRANKSADIFKTFIATVKLQDWMRRENFGQFLNDWGLVLAGYNDAIVKFVEKEGRLIPSVIPWTRIICDSVDFENNPKIEVLEFTEAQLFLNKAYDQEMVEKLCDAKKARETVGKQRKDNKNDYIKVYEVHGLFPRSFITGNDADEDTYSQQMHTISFLANKNGTGFDDFTLVKGEEEKDPYMLTSLLREVDGSISLKGAVKTLFESQWMINHSVKAIKDQLDLASKLIFQTSDGNFIGQNALTAIETGDILIHSPNEPLTQLANNSHDITSLQNFGSQWKALSQEIASTPDAMIGNNAPSGTAWRQVEALQQEAHSLFELMTENKGLSIEQMLRVFVIPFIKKKLNNNKEMSAILEDYDITKVDSKYIKSKATKITNEKIVEMVINGERPTNEQQALMQSVVENGLQKSLMENGNQRFFVPDDIDKSVTWKDILGDIEWDVVVDVTGENAFNRDDLATLATVLQTIGANPDILKNPNAKMLFNKILTLTGAVDPMEFTPEDISNPVPVTQQTTLPENPIPGMESTATPPMAP